MQAKRNRPHIPYIGILLMLLIMAVMLNRPTNYTELKTSEVIDLFRNNKVESYELYLSNNNVRIKKITIRKKNVKKNS